MKTLRALPLGLALLLIACPLMGQTPQDSPQKFIAAGLAFFPSASPQIQGWGNLAIPINAKIYSFTGYDVAALPGDKIAGQKITVPKIAYTFRTGVAIHIYQISKSVNLYGLGDAGLAAAADNVSGSFSGGGFVDIAFGKGWGGMFIIQINHSGITGSEVIPRFGIRKRL